MTQNVPSLLTQDGCAALQMASACLLLLAALHDFAFRTVPNWLSCLILTTGLILHTLDGHLLYSLGSVALLFVAAFVCWRCNVMGGGDVKLLAAAASLLPVGTRFNFVLLVAVAGGILALLYLILQRVIRTTSRQQRPSDIIRRVLKAERWRIARRGPIPYASAIAAGALCMILRG